jgi:hypothetical protein
MNPLRNFCTAAALACGALLAAPASAVVVSSVSGPSVNTVSDFSTAGLAALNFDIGQLYTSTTIQFTLEDADIGAPLLFNAVVANLTGAGIGNFFVSLANATFQTVGGVETLFGATATTSLDGTMQYASIRFDPADTYGFNLGDPFAGGQYPDWEISTAGLSAGDSFSLTMGTPVSEPGTLVLLLAALIGSLGTLLRRSPPRV